MQPFRYFSSDDQFRADFCNDFEAVLRDHARQHLLARESVLEGMARRFLGPKCPRDGADMATVMLARGMSFVESVPQLGRRLFWLMDASGRIVDEQPVPPLSGANGR